MRCLVRAGLAAALVAFVFLPALAADKAVQAERARRGGDQARSADQERCRQCQQACRDVAARCRCRLPEERFPRRHAGARPARRRRAGRCDELVAAVARRAADQAARRPRESAVARPRLDRRLHRLPARARPQRRSRQPVGSRPDACRPAAVARCARFPAPVARAAGDRRPSRPVRKTARRARVPAARLYGRFRFGFTARLLPVFRGAAGPAHRLLSVCRRCGLSKDRRSPRARSSFASRASSTANVTR